MALNMSWVSSDKLSRKLFEHAAAGFAAFQVQLEVGCSSYGPG